MSNTDYSVRQLMTARSNKLRRIIAKCNTPDIPVGSIETRQLLLHAPAVPQRSEPANQARPRVLPVRPPQQWPCYTRYGANHQQGPILPPQRPFLIIIIVLTITTTTTKSGAENPRRERRGVDRRAQHQRPIHPPLFGLSEIVLKKSPVLHHPEMAAVRALGYGGVCAEYQQPTHEEHQYVRHKSRLHYPSY